VSVRDAIPAARELPPNWKFVTLREVTTKIGSGATPRGGDSEYLPLRDKFALIRSQNVFDQRFEIGGLAFISDEQAAALANAQVRSGDVLLNITGDGVTFARACLVPDGILPACVNQHVSIVRSNPSFVDPGYLAAYLAHPSTKGYIESFNAGGSRRAITKGHIESFQVPLPPLIEQKQISAMLGAINRKIGLNLDMNATLEAIARAIFKSWFVDFDPVRAKAADRSLDSELMKLFPSTFVETELGAAPSGWKPATLGTLCRRVAMGPFGSDIKTDNFVDAGVPVIRGSNLKSGFVDEGFVYVTNNKADELRHANAFPDDIAITHRGTLGQVGIIPRDGRFSRYVVSQSQMVLSVDSKLATPRFVFEFLRSAEGLHQLLSNTSQTGVPAVARPTRAVKAMRLILPPIELLAKFQTIIEPLAARQIANDHQSRTLVSIRDMILPQLMSGEIRIKTAEKIVEANA
jgi:type I restriction enzyme S subunit